MKKLGNKVLFLIGFAALLWGIEIADVLSNHMLDRMGALHPRTSQGLWQIFTAPFLHANFAHLFSNTLGLFMVGSLTLLEGAFGEVMLMSILIGGAGVWLFGTPGTAELGFSGVLFGMMGFVMARGFFEHKLSSILLSFLAMAWFGGSLFIGLVPSQGISWAGHFWGLVAGLVAAKTLPEQRD